VVHHALCNIIEPIFDQNFIFDSYACREGKGTHKAVKRLKEFLRSFAFAERERERESKNAGCEIYCLQCDISKYFDSINHRILFEILQRKISDKKVLWLIQEILNSNNKEIGKGIPIGNLTSQLFANVYLNELDQYVKRILKRRYYIRYMDDFLIFGESKQELWQVKEAIAGFLKSRLDLNLHSRKAIVFQANKGIEFLGYKVFSNYRILRKSTVKRIVRKLKRYKAKIRTGDVEPEKLARAVESWKAYARFADSWHTIRRFSKITIPKN